MTKDEYTKAASFWTAKEAASKKMPAAELKEKVASFLQQHNTCALATGGFGKLNGMQVTGKAVMVDGDSDEYTSLLNFKKIPLAAIHQLTHPMYCIKIVPSHVDFLCTAFKDSGFDARQTLNL